MASGPKPRDVHVGYSVAAIILLLLFQAWWMETHTAEPIPYSRFETLLDSGEVAEAAVGPDRIEGRLKTPLPSGNERFVTLRVDSQIARKLEDAGVAFEGRAPPTFLPMLLSWVIPAVIFFAIWSLFIRRIADRQGLSGPMSIGKSKAKVYVETDTRVSFDDVAGVDEAKAELAEIVDFLKDPGKYAAIGARAPKGVLLVGPPGTGKTLLARAVAGEAGTAFFSISGSEFVEMFVGVGAARVRDLFEQARKAAPAIVFIDELDALGRARGAGPILGGDNEKEQTLNQLLAEMDGFDPSGGVVLIAATNRPEVLDPALLRAGRFDRQVLVDRPERTGRAAILKVHVRAIRLAPDLDLDAVAAMTPGFSGADLANLCNEAAIRAVRAGRDAVTLADFTAAMERIVAGLERRNRLLNPLERRIVAHHEIGHALVALSLPGQDPVQKISIIPRGVGALGYTLQRPLEDRFLMRREELMNRMAVMLGGRAAEEVIFAEVSTGASDDLQRATEMARAMVTRYGMTSALGDVAYETETGGFLGHAAEGGGRRYSETTGHEIDQAVRSLIDEAHAAARAILERRRAELESLAAALLERETLTAADLPAPVDRAAA